MKKNSSLMRDESGAITAMTAIMMAAFVGILALIIDLGHLHTVQNELRNAADACALRGARAFYADVKPFVEPADDLRAATEAKGTVGMNYSDNALLQTIQDEDIKVGVWDFANRTWLYGSAEAPLFTWPPDTADYGKVIGPGISLWTRKEGTLNSGPVSMTLARVFNIPSVNVDTPATAALSPLGESGEDNWDANGQPPPLQLGDKYAKLGSGTLTVSPDITDSGSWQSYYGLGKLTPPLAESLIWGTTPSGDPIPTIDVNISSQASIDRQNGDLAKLFELNNPLSLINRWLQKTGAEVDAQGEITKEVQTPWEVILPVTSSDSPYNQSAPVLGFVKATIDRVYPQNYPNYTDPTTGEMIKKRMNIDITISEVTGVSTGKGGGAYYGIMSVDPVLVK